MQISTAVRNAIRKYAVKNATDYGRANEGAVLSKIISLHPELKGDIKSLALEVKKEVAEVNSLDKHKLKEEYLKHEEEFNQAQAKKAEASAKHNFSIEGAEKGSFATRFPPEPGGYMHIGHAKPVFIEDELRRVYEGKLMLYFDDTNPDNERQEFVDMFKEDLKWLGIRFDAEYYASDNIPTLYRYAEQAIKKGKAYVCTCSEDLIKENRSAGRGCDHREQGIEDNIGMWRKMLAGEFKHSEAILRIKADMSSLNTTMRDPTVFRIKHAKHYRQGTKYFVWPTYDFCTPIMDSTKGITDAIRSKEYELRDELDFTILDILGLRKPRIISFSRLEIADNVTSKRKIRELVSSKMIEGYDDPRLVTIRALKRRGIKPQAIKEFALSFGLGKGESVVELEVLLNINRKIIDPVAKRLFFIEKPSQLHIEGMEQEQEISLRLHPTAQLGHRKYRPSDKLLIDESEALKLRPGDLVRLKEAYNIKITKVEKGAVSAEYAHDQKPAAQKLRWMNEEGSVKCELWGIGKLFTDGAFNKDSISKKDGYAEGYASKLNVDDIVQFEAFGYYKLDSHKQMRFISL